MKLKEYRFLVPAHMICWIIQCAGTRSSADEVERFLAHRGIEVEVTIREHEEELTDGND